MNKKIITWLSLMTVFMALLWSCHNEDFAKGEPDPQRNNADFFKHSSLNTKSGVDYISILEAYNKETNFLSTMPDQKGMPIWDKMQIVDTENATGLMIPLSHDNETLSSVLFATLDDRNSVTGLKDYDNAMLKNIVYNENISKESREQLFFTFMYMDNKTFGNEHFTNIPKDLFVGQKYNDEYGRIWMKDFGKPTIVQNETSKLLWIEICYNTWHCTHHGEGACDLCPACFTSTCTMTTIWIDDPIVSPPGPSGGGGGGGGTPGSGGIPPKDPCIYSSDIFYRPAVGCNGGGTGDPDLGLDDPCEKALEPVNNVNNILHASTISTEVNILKQRAANDHYEYGTAIINTGTTIIAQDPYSNNDPNDPGHVGISVPPVGDYLASAHTHPDHGAAPPSAKDLYNALSNSKDYLTFQSSFVFSSNGTIYAFVVTDRDKAIAFLAAYPFASNTEDEGRIFNESSSVGKDFRDIYKNYMQGRLPSYSGNSQNDGMESAFARILQKYNSGINLAKTDSNGNLKPLQSTSFNYTIPASGGKTIIGYKAEPCP